MKNIGGNALVIREVNINLVRKALKEQGQATKRQIAENTGLSIVTVGTVLQYLLEQQEVREGDLISSSGGRPAQQYIYNDEHSLSLILFPYEEDSGIHIRRTVVTLSGRRLHDVTIPVTRIDLSSFETLIDEAMLQYPAIQAIGFGLPGAEIDGKMLVSDYIDLRNISVTEHFRNRYGKPVVLENDVNAAVIGYCNRLQETRESSVVYMYFPDRFGPGAGIYINGRLHKGKRGFAGEVANIPLGIPWGDPSLITSFERITEAIAKLTAAVNSVLNPDLVVLYGSFLTDHHLRSVVDQCSLFLPGSTVPDIRLTEDFTADYLQGMIVQTLRTLEPGLQLTKSET
ncbi:ROK family protein [Paenibacillus ihuae]|uniref:ROK family protein n=1 Tax=Paenibacillus ihuae TaxID=1232431 RepID=UPI0006D57CB7|nr:ROK family protein [Paenibacillus ihuae]